MGPTKRVQDPQNLMAPTWILTNHREYIGNCVLKSVLLVLLYNQILLENQEPKVFSFTVHMKLTFQQPT